MSADQGLIDSVANENTKVGSGAPAFYAASAMKAHISTMEALDQAKVLAVQNFTAAMGVLNKALVEEDPAEAVAQQKLLSGNDLAQQLSQLASAIAGIQQNLKGAQTTPPETGKVG